MMRRNKKCKIIVLSPHSQYFIQNTMFFFFNAYRRIYSIYILLFLTIYVLYTHVYLAMSAGMCEIVAS